jgi:PAS domain S-box-containing protein
MRRTRSAQHFSKDEISASAGLPVDPMQLSRALIANSPLGIGIWDRRLRFRFINNALASMNGYPSQEHLGKPLHKMLGSLADQVAPTHERVFATGELFRHVHSSGLLPTRTEVGHWIETGFPLRDKAGKIAYVAGIILEVTPIIKLQESIQDLAGALRDANLSLEPQGISVSDSLAPVLKRCISQLRAMSDFLNPILLGNVAASLRDPLSQFTRASGDLSMPPAPPRTDTSVPLSSREQQVLRLLALGKTNKEIAEVLNIGARTVETYRARLMLKLGLHSVPQLVRYALRNRLI